MLKWDIFHDFPSQKPSIFFGAAIAMEPPIQVSASVPMIRRCFPQSFHRGNFPSSEEQSDEPPFLEARAVQTPFSGEKMVKILGNEEGQRTAWW